METTKYKIYDFFSGKVTTNESYPENDGLVMPFVGLEDMDGNELFLYDVLLDENNEGWILGFHEKGYLFLERIGSDKYEELLPVMEIPNFDFGKHYYRIPMKCIGNSYVNYLQNSMATPKSSRLRLVKYLKGIGILEESYED